MNPKLIPLPDHPSDQERLECLADLKREEIGRMTVEERYWLHVIEVDAHARRIGVQG